ncbi:alpha/beta hydrolase [Micromonospora andamanensis]|uniref:alpha/beta hydrolase n=1 Tax=Micromonospora andamanensis TaxID=1287068 RepID=UPI001950103E|nr:alpha/beta hydrolase-fold protein [Micromonospora andamanensis]
MTEKVPFRPLAVDQSDVRYLHGPDSRRQPGRPIGQTIEFGWDDSKIYPGTSRKFWVHLPARYDPSRPASLVVFLDGQWYLDPTGEVRGAIVLDNLIHRGDIPVTVGLFVDPGILVDAEHPKNRNVEYDAFDDRLATFLLTEIIPQVTTRYSIAEDPDRWAICGGSSGGNAAFTAAWLRPDKFRRVLCCLSSFVQMPGGNPYPEIIATEARRPLRIFMQAGHRDLHWNEPHRNWLSQNLRVAAALAEAGYDFRLVLGDGGHSPNHCGVLLPDALRWLWRPQARSRVCSGDVDRTSGVTASSSADPAAKTAAPR